jgi:prepilin-type N-terminal cleavage/methylation domain-containing protein
VTIRRRMTARSDRQAFTLLEVLLVLALLVVLASLSWPALTYPMANQALRSAADEIRTSWSRARVAAMTSGSTYVFQAYTAPQGAMVPKGEQRRDYYTIDRQLTPEASADLSPAELQAVEQGFVEEGSPPLAVNDRLPEGIRFVGGETAADSRAQTASPGVSPGLNQGLPLGDPIFFYPDGTTSTSRLRLQNEYGRWMELSIRGLTGVVTVGPVQNAQP